MDYLGDHYRVYYTVYRVMLESDVRFEHILWMMGLWNLGEVLEIFSTSVVTRRLICFGDRRFCHYYMEVKGRLASRQVGTLLYEDPRAYGDRQLPGIQSTSSTEVC